MSFYAVAVGVVGEGVAAGILGGAMMGATTTVASNVIGGRDPFDNIGRGVVMGGLTGGLTPGVAEAFQVGMPAAAGITAFGLNTLATGDLGKGLAAGATAYGLYGLSENMAAAGNFESALSSDALNAQLANVGQGGDYFSDSLSSGNAFTSSSGDAFNKFLTSDANPAVSEALKNATPFDKVSAGFDAAKAAPGTFLKDNAKYLMYTAGGTLADAGVKSNMPTTTTRPGAMRRFSYDPYGQIYTPIGNYEVPVKAAGGGLMGMNDGGYSPGQLNFAERSEPVVRMAVGGQTVEELYASIGNTNPDKEGLAFWTGNFGTGPVTAEQASSFMQSANAALAQRSPTDQLALAPILAAENAVSGGEYGRNLATVGQTGAGATATDTSGGLNNLAAANNIANVTTGGATTGATALTGGATTGATAAGTSLPDAQLAVNNIYRNVLGRDADATGLNFWSNAIAGGRSVDSVYQDILKSANTIKSAGTLGDFGIKALSTADATKPYAGFTSTEGNTIADEWVRNTLGREPTDADRTQSWYKNVANLGTSADATKVYGDFSKYATTETNAEIASRIAVIDAELRAKGLTDADLLSQTGKTKQQLAAEGFKTGLGFMGASQLAPAGNRATFDLKAALKKLTPITNTSDGSVVARTITNPAGNAINPGDLTRNVDGTTTVTPNIPYRPYGGFPGMASVRNAYTQGGGSLGYIPYAPKTIEEFDEKYNKLTGGSKQAYDYLTGKTKYSATPFTETGEVMKPYSESVLGVPRSLSSKRVLFDPVTKKYKNNPDYIPVSYTDKGKKVYGLSGRDINSYISGLGAGNSVPGQIAGQVKAAMAVPKWMKENNVTYAQIAEALGISLTEAEKRYPAGAGGGDSSDNLNVNFATGGLAAMAGGGMAQQFDLGGYSDGGRLLRGTGDGVSDSIPATIGNKRPARLADGEFVVPARIVSELGNGSTEAGARKLYAMMDRVQAARRGSIGKGKVAKNSRADKYLPA
jgi:hypothetical protein